MRHVCDEVISEFLQVQAQDQLGARSLRTAAFGIRRNSIGVLKFQTPT